MVFTLVKLNDDFMIGKPNYKAPLKKENISAIADHVKNTCGERK